MEAGDTIVAIFMVLIIAAISCLIGAALTENAWRNALIENGGGYWSIDAKTGKPSFVWKVYPKDEVQKEKK